jgi:hypothetical protein
LRVKLYVIVGNLLLGNTQFSRYTLCLRRSRHVTKVLKQFHVTVASIPVSDFVLPFGVTKVKATYSYYIENASYENLTC